MFFVALFMILRNKKQPRYSSTDEWTMEVWYGYAMEFYSAVKENEIREFGEQWMDLVLFSFGQLDGN